MYTGWQLHSADTEGKMIAAHGRIRLQQYKLTKPWKCAHKGRTARAGRGLG